MFNRCIELGYFPEELKTGVVKPLHKGGSTDQLNNFRPIALLSCIAKIFEKIIKHQLTIFFNKHNIISNKQFGFRKGIGTQDALVNLVSDIYDNMDRSKTSAALFLDLTKAFDTVSHSLLLKKLELYGIRGVALTLFKSYLSDRVQTVCINDVISSGRIIKCGVPQGSILGPILFNIYINDLLHININAKLLSYADDTVLYAAGDTWSQVLDSLSECMTTLKHWFDNNLLTINYDKTYFVPFTSYINKLPTEDFILIHEVNCSPVTCNCTTVINKASSVKYLGIHIDSHLRWDIHINIIIKKLRRYIYLFKNLKNILNIRSLKILYFSFIQSTLSYGNIIWGSASSTYLKKLEGTQKIILKIIFNKNKRYSSDLLFSVAEVYPLKHLYVLSILKFMYKNDLSLYISTPNHSYGTRFNTNQIALNKKTLKAIGQNYFIYFIPKIYNHFILHYNYNLICRYSFKTYVTKIKNILNSIDLITMSVILT